MATCAYKQFDVVRYTSAGVLTPVVSTTLTAYNETAASSLGTVSVDANGIVASGTFTATVGDIVRFTHASYAGKFRLRLAATKSEAYEDVEYRSSTFVVENARTARTPQGVDIWGRDKNNPETGKFYIGTGKVGDTGLEFSYQSTIDQDIELFAVPRLTKGVLTQADFDIDNIEEVAVTGTGGGGGTGDVSGGASSTDNAIARYDGTTGKIIQNSVVTVADTTGIIAGSQGINVAGSTSGAVNIRVAATAGSNTLTFPAGTTDFSATGGTGQVLKQTSAGGAITVAALLTADLPAGTGDTIGAASSTDNAIVRWDGTTGKIIQNSAPTIADTTGIISGTQGVNIAGSSSGAVNLRVPAAAGSNTLTFPAGTTDFSSTGGSTQFVRQNSSGGAFTVGAIAGNDLTTNLKTFYLNGTYGHTNSGLASAITAISTTRAKLVITEDLTVSSTQTIPATCVLSVENNAKITISSSATLTIGKFADPGNVQCFTGVSSANHILFAAGALPRDTVNLGWFGVSNDDMTYPVTDICTSLTTNGGGTIFVPVGNWKVNNITLPTYFVRVRGEAMGSDTGGSRFIPKDSGTSYLFNVRNNFRNISFEHCALSVGTNTTTNAFNIDVDSGSSGFGIDFDHVLFHGSGSSSYPLLNTVTDSGAAEFVRGSVTNSQFIIPNGSTGMYVDSINTQIPVSQSTFSVGSGSSYGIYYYRNAEPSVTNCDFRGVAGSYSQTSAGTGTFTVNSGSTLVTGTFTRAMLGQEFAGTGVTAGTYISQIYTSTTAKLSAAASANNTGTYTWYKYVENTSRAGTCILVGDIGGAFIQGCQEEGFNYFVHVIGVGLDRPTVLVANDIQDRIKLEGTSSLHLVGNARHSNSLVDTSGSSAEIISTDYVGPNLPESLAVTLVEANDWSQLRAGSSYFKQNTGNKVGLYQQEFPYFTRILEESASELTRPLLDVSTTYESSGVTGQILQRWGLNDAVSKTQQYGLTLNRSDPATDAGYWIWKTTQAHPYNGELRNFVTGYGADVHAAVTQGTSRTTAVTCNSATGVITCYTYASTQLQPGESITFTLNNTYIKNGCHFDVQVIDGAVGTKTEADSFDWGGNAATITVKNGHLSTAETSTALKLKFHVWADGGQSGRTP